MDGKRRGRKDGTHHGDVPARVPQLGRRDDGDGAAEAVARRDDLVARIGGGEGGVQGGQQVRFQLQPGGVETLVDEAARTDVGGDEGDQGVDDVVAARGGAAHGEHEEFVGWVDG